MLFCCSSGGDDGRGSSVAGRENDAAGLYSYRARYYNPSFQRFISEDPIGFSGGFNLYAYVGNNPINFMDPLGLKPQRAKPPKKDPPPPPPPSTPPPPPDKPPDDQPPIPRPKLPPAVCSLLPWVEGGGDILDAAHTLRHPGEGGVLGPGGGFPLLVISTTFHTVFCD